jgi:hypothetical protein
MNLIIRSLEQGWTERQCLHHRPEHRHEEPDAEDQHHEVIDRLFSIG